MNKNTKNNARKITLTRNTLQRLDGARLKTEENEKGITTVFPRVSKNFLCPIVMSCFNICV